MNQLRLSSSLNLHGGSREDMRAYIRSGLTFFKRHGFDAADFPMNAKLCMDANWMQTVTDTLLASQELSLHFELCHLPYGVKIGGTAEEVAHFNDAMHRAIDGARLLGVKYAVLHPNTTTVPEECYDPQAQYDSVMAHLEPFANHAERIGLSLAVENMRIVPQHYPVRRYCGTPQELCTIADALGIGVCWDFGHAHINRLTQSESLKYVGNRLKVLHVNDNFAWGDDHVPPFCGNLDWQDAMQGLKDVNFSGLLNYEVSAARIPDSARDAFAQYLVQAGRALNAML